MPVRRSLPRLFAALVALLVALPAWAVDLNATLKGLVSDADGLPVPGVELTLSAPELQGTRSTATDADGRYRFTPLPPGTYTVAASKKGFQDYESVPLKIPVGTTAQLDIRLLAKGASQMDIDVVAAAPAVDTESVRAGAVLDAEFLKDIPTGRDYQSVTAVTPGVVGGGNANVRGAFDSSNQFYIDGVNITDPMTNTFSTNMNYDAIESIQVITGGMDAEYGRSLGGAINIVTKSGGNQFEGQVNLIYHQGPSMVLARPIEEYGDRFDSNLEQQLVLNLGGPILKDKVWFFGSLQGDRLVRNTSFDNAEIGRDLDTHPMVPRDWRSLYWFGKITAQPSEAHRIWTQLQGDPTIIDNVTQDPFTLPSGEMRQIQTGILGSIGHQWTPNDSLIVETQLYHQRSTIDAVPQLWQHCQERVNEANIGSAPAGRDTIGDCIHGFEGMEYLGATVTEPRLGFDVGDFSSGEFPYASLNRRFRTSFNTSATLLFDLLGEHRAKAGFQAEQLTSRETWPGQDTRGLPYYSYDEALDPEGVGPSNLDAYAPSQIYLWDNPWELRFTGTLVSWYLQDVYKPHRRLTIRPGLRFDHSAMYNEDDQTTKQDEGGEVIFSTLTVAPRIGVAYDLTGDGKTRVHGYYGRFYDSGFLILSALLQNTSQGFEAYGWDRATQDWDYDNPIFSVSDQFLKHPDLRNPYSDEIDIGVARELGPGLSLSATFTYEYSARFYEDDEVNLIWNDDGSEVVGYRNGVNEAVFRLRTPDNSFTKYTGLEIVVAKQHTDHWSFLGSYTWSRATGTNSADQASAAGDIPEQRRYEIGFLDYNRTHALKASGSYTQDDVARVGRTGLGYVLGWNFRMYSGFNYRPLSLNTYYGSFSNYEGPSDGRFQLPAFAQTDLRGGLKFGVEDLTDWMLGVDVFNVFNDRQVTAVNTQYAPEQPLGESAFGTPIGRQEPRRLQISIRGEF